jgi:hypothetical protein
MFDWRTARLAVALAIWIGPLLAESRAAGDDTTLIELIRSHPECRQFNDGCSICKVENGAPVCSAPAIACIRTGWTCVSTGADTQIEGGSEVLARAASVGSAGGAARRALQRR